MDEAPQPWLPADALAPERVRPALEKLAAEWSRHWLAGTAAILSPAFEDSRSAISPRARWRSAPGVMGIELGAQAEAAIAGAMLEASVPSSLDGADRRVVEELAAAAIDDLLVRAGRLAGAESGQAPRSSDPVDLEGAVWWAISFAPGRRAFRFAIPRPAIVRIVKQGLAAAGPRALASPRQALGAKEIKVSACAGRCSIALSDLTDLGPGDVLVLDGEAGAPLSLLVNGRPSSLRASLEAKGDKAALLLL